jgi:hypothetical protein
MIVVRDERENKFPTNRKSISEIVDLMLVVCLKWIIAH